MTHDLCSRRLARALVAFVVCGLFLALAATRSMASEFGPLPPPNPYTSANGAATMHSDSESSNASPYPGPGTGTEVATPNELAAACPTVLQGSDGMPVALCTSIVGRNPVVYLLDPSTGSTLASLSLPAGNLFAGVYAYMDQEDRVVLFNAEGNLLRIGHHDSNGTWSLSIDSSTPAAAAIDAHCASLCGGVVGIAPDWDGRVWFVTAGGVAGYVEPQTGAVKTIVLGSGEQVANSISTAPEGTAIATDHALYLLTAKKKGPKILWRYEYERGPARKPGQLSHGTGSTPTFFGPEDGTRYLTILDNASPAEHLLVFDTWAKSHFHRRTGAYTYKVAKAPQLVCDLPALTPGPSGSENNPVGSGRSVFVASTYGYPYPSLPEGAEPSEPETAPFEGGVERIDLNQAGSGCTARWQDEVRSAAVPRLDVANGILYTVQDTDPLEPDGTGLTDAYSEDAIDAATGQVLHQTLLGATYAFNTLQLAPAIVPGEVIYQGTVTGILRIAPAHG
jgi:streptogramin lyase